VVALARLSMTGDDFLLNDVDCVLDAGSYL